MPICQKEKIMKKGKLKGWKINPWMLFFFLILSGISRIFSCFVISLFFFLFLPWFVLSFFHSFFYFLNIILDLFSSFLLYIFLSFILRNLFCYFSFCFCFQLSFSFSLFFTFFRFLSFTFKSGIKKHSTLLSFG